MENLDIIYNISKQLIIHDYRNKRKNSLINSKYKESIEKLDSIYSQQSSITMATQIRHWRPEMDCTEILDQNFIIFDNYESLKKWKENTYDFQTSMQGLESNIIRCELFVEYFCDSNFSGFMNWGIENYHYYENELPEDPNFTSRLEEILYHSNIGDTITYIPDNDEGIKNYQVIHENGEKKIKEEDSNQLNFYEYQKDNNKINLDIDFNSDDLNFIISPDSLRNDEVKKNYESIEKYIEKTNYELFFIYFFEITNFQNLEDPIGFSFIITPYYDENITKMCNFLEYNKIKKNTLDKHNYAKYAYKDYNLPNDWKEYIVD